MLFLVATPIGNLSDITYRAVETLKSVDYILCEDTRKSGILLKQYGIEKPLKSFHKFSEKKLEEWVLSDLGEGKQIALISDAGTPGISDPGQRLIERCIEQKLPFTSLPGPSAPIVALSLSGFKMDRFQFSGFLSKKASERKTALIDALFYPGVSIFFESPERVHKTLEEIAQLGPDHQVAVVREMTKIYEECLKGKAIELLNAQIRGEVVLLIEGHAKIHYTQSPAEHVRELQEQFDLSKQEAIKLAAELRGVPKKELYSCLISEEKL
ncbi:MAG: 16S rRNA (cytidine(1402)-2'-O)-methyltransferase [Verrucomicrobia bacterium]|nr:16S rRNA (cytidine(1402)-2'-O)-methyltransferase [Verrucomicrobiota bacterium]